MVCACLISLFGWAAFLYVCYRLYTLLYGIIYPFLLGTPINLKKAAGGKWAVITGSTEGIGKAYAFELARKGFSIVLISRSPTKLESVRTQIVQETRAEVKTIVFDFTCTSVGEYEQKILSELKTLDVGIVVNNVGATFDCPEVLHKNPGGLQKMADIDIINTLGVTLLSAAILPQMVERNSGIIVNISSVACYFTMKATNVYSATKAYVTMLTRIMQKEYADKDIIIQLVAPGPVLTNLAPPEAKDYKDNKPSIFQMKPDEYARQAVRSIGLIGETTGCLMHQIQMFIAELLPNKYIDRYVDNEVTEFREFLLKKRGIKLSH